MTFIFGGGGCTNSSGISSSSQLVRIRDYLEAHTLSPFLRCLLFKITGPNHKTRYPKQGVGYEPLGRALEGLRVSGWRSYLVQGVGTRGCVP